MYFFSEKTIAYEKQICIGQIVSKNKIGIWNIFNMLVKYNNFISVDFQTQVSVWFLISMKFCTRIINKKRRHESAIVSNL